MKTHPLPSKPTLLRGLHSTNNKCTNSLSSIYNFPHDQLYDQWREIHGQDGWAGLLDPIDPLLRSKLNRYGEFAQACYDAFDHDPFSRYCGSSKLGSCKFFRRSVVGKHLWSQRANWIGYIAVSTDAATSRLGCRDIIVDWRGTVTRLKLIEDLMDYLRPVSKVGISCSDTTVKVESGFMDLYTNKDPTCQFCEYSAREQVPRLFL